MNRSIAIAVVHLIVEIYSSYSYYIIIMAFIKVIVKAYTITIANFIPMLVTNLNFFRIDQVCNLMAITIYSFKFKPKLAIITFDISPLDNRHLPN